MSKQDQPKGRPLAIDPTATSAKPTEPAFVARPKGAPVYYGFAALEDVIAEGFTFGAITDFEAEPCDRGDAFVIAPDGSRAGLVWDLSAKEYFEEILPFDQERWGVWAVSFQHPMESRANARENLRALVPQLKARWEEWKRWRSKESG
jgi:hypothetical protein